MKVKSKISFVIMLLGVLFLSSCNSTKAISKSSTPDVVVASYYHNKFNGRKTASGEKFRNSKLTAAHKTLPFGTIVKVTNSSNNKSVKVRINDRGPFVKGREIDLSKKAFMQIADHKDQGLLKVRIKVLSK